MKPRAFSALLALICGLIGSPAEASDAGIQGAQAITILNQQRQANGIPPIPNVNQNYAAAWCPDEDNGPSGGEVVRDLSPNMSWSGTTSPWDDAPLHQQDLYNPIFSTAGEVNAGVDACFGAGSPISEPPTPTFYTFISEAGPEGVPNSETVYGEGPFAPQQVVGLPLGVPTGPDIILYALGFPAETVFASGSVNPSAWSLASSDGTPVPSVQMVDEDAGAAYGYPSYVDGDTAFLIPPVLKPGTSYQGSVTWQGPDGTTATQTFSFTTAVLSNQVTVHAVEVHSTAKVTVSSNAPDPALTLSGPKQLTPELGVTGSATVMLTPGTWRACASSGGGTTGYAQAQECTEFTVKPPPVVKKKVVRSASGQATAPVSKSRTARSGAHVASSSKKDSGHSHG